MSAAFSAAAIVQWVCKVLIMVFIMNIYWNGELDFDNKNLIQCSPGFTIVLTTENKLFFPFKFALFLLFLLLRTIRKQKIRNKQFWKYSSDYKRTWQNDNCILCSFPLLSPLCLRRIQSIFCFTHRCPPSCSRIVTGGFVKDVIVLINASKVDKTEPYSNIVWLHSIREMWNSCKYELYCAAMYKQEFLHAPTLILKVPLKGISDLATISQSERRRGRLTLLEAMNVMERWYRLGSVRTPEWMNFLKDKFSRSKKTSEHQPGTYFICLSYYSPSPGSHGFDCLVSFCLNSTEILLVCRLWLNIGYQYWSC